MKGFFDIDELQEAGRGNPSYASPGKKGQAKTNYTCEDCGLSKRCLSPKMKPSGKGKKEILIIAEAPGKEEDRQGTQLIGTSGQIVRDTLEEFGYDLDKDCIKTNALICRPPKNANPTSLQINACRQNLLNLIKEYKPKVIVLLGKFAFEGLLGHRINGRISSVPFSSWVGLQIPDQELEAWVCPMNHPAHLLYNPKDKVLKKMWRKHLREALRKTEQPFYCTNYTSDIMITEDEGEAIDWIRDARKNKEIIVFDYETTSIKPHREDQEIVCASFSDGLFGWSFPFFKSDAFRKEWEKLLKSKNVLKIAHNIKFEDQWTKEKEGYWVRGWYWDTMTTAHVLYNQKTTQLKFWVYITLGILGFDDIVDNYITKTAKGEDPKSGNSRNCIWDLIEEYGWKPILEYNAQDSLYGYKLYENQKAKMTRFQSKGDRLLLEGSQALIRAQQVGIRLDEEQMERESIKIKRKLERLESKIMNSEEAGKWDGSKKFKFTSNQQLSHLLYDILGYDVIAKTGGDSPKTDMDTLSKLARDEDRFLKNILEWRRWDKVIGTYMGQFKREVIDGIIHPNYNLHIADTFRSSSDHPNFQNIPKRDKQVKQILRSLLIPSPGNMLIEYDYKGAEVSTAASVTGDPNLIRYVSDLSNDMHRDVGGDIFLRDPADVTNDERQSTKNKFVFREFYGGYYEQVAPEMWEEMEKESKIHLKKNGIRALKDFTAHLRDIEADFWENRFPAYAEWKEKVWKEYQRKGYIDLVTGFRCYGPLDKKQVTNYKIQGPAFHILLWSFSETTKETGKRLTRSHHIGQIHDAAVSSVHPEEESVLDAIMYEYGTQKVRDNWDWITVPLSIEKERSKIDGNWAEMTKCGYLKGE